MFYSLDASIFYVVIYRLLHILDCVCILLVTFICISGLTPTVNDSTTESQIQNDNERYGYTTNIPSMSVDDDALFVSNQNESTIGNVSAVNRLQHYTEIDDVPQILPSIRTLPISLKPTLPTRPAKVSTAAIIHVSNDGYLTPRPRPFQTSQRSATALSVFAKEFESRRWYKAGPMSKKSSREDESVQESGGLNVTNDGSVSRSSTCKSKRRTTGDGSILDLECTLINQGAQIFKEKRHKNIRSIHSERKSKADKQGFVTSVNSKIEIEEYVVDSANTSLTLSDGGYVIMREKQSKENEEAGLEKAKSKSIPTPIKHIAGRLNQNTSIKELSGKLSSCSNDRYQNENNDLTKQRGTMDDTNAYNTTARLPMVPDNVNGMQCLHKCGDFNEERQQADCIYCGLDLWHFRIETLQVMRCDLLWKWTVPDIFNYSNPPEFRYRQITGSKTCNILQIIVNRKLPITNT